MLKRYHRVVGTTFRIVDALVVGIVWLLSYWVRFYVPIVEVTKGLPPFQKYASLMPLVIGVWMIVFSATRVYQSRRMLRRTDEAFTLLRAHGVAMLVFVTLTYLFSEFRYSRGVMISFGVLGAFALVSFRLALRNALRIIRKRGYNLRRVLIVGEGGALGLLVAKMERFPELGLRVVGALAHPDSSAKTIAEKPVLGKFNEIESVIRSQSIDQVLIALPRNQSGELDGILKRIQDETVDIRFVPDIHDYVTLGCEVEDYDGMPIVNLNDSPLDGWGAIAKRMTDIFVSIVALVLLSPLLLLIAIATKLSSKGPVIYKQERMGLDGKTFHMLKFRSMRVDAEAKTGAVWAQKNDDRKTWLGSLLRATSLDELPQFWNVLRGDMSLVGPRPERPVFVTQFRGDIPHYMLRHKVKAGITGWAQIHGWRGNTSLDKRIEYDLYYIRNWSYGLDWKILVMTLWKGFIHKNAY